MSDEGRDIIAAIVATVGCIPTRKGATVEQQLAVGSEELRSCFMLKRGEICDCRKSADAIIAALAAAGLTPRKEPTTIAELQAEIGRLQARLHFLVLGDPTVCVSFPSATPGARQR